MDIGPGDVVEAVRDVVGVDRQGVGFWISKGFRRVVSAVGLSGADPHQGCFSCGETKRFVQLENALEGEWLWCLCGFRKIGGSQADTVARFTRIAAHASELVDV